MSILGSPSPRPCIQDIRILKLNSSLTGSSTQGLTSDGIKRACYHLLQPISLFITTAFGTKAQLLTLFSVTHHSIKWPMKTCWVFWREATYTQVLSSRPGNGTLSGWHVDFSFTPSVEWAGQAKQISWVLKSPPPLGVLQSEVVVVLPKARSQTPGQHTSPTSQLRGRR